MCGIFGVLGKNDIKKKKILNSLKLLRHRGPDKQKFQYDKISILGHTRLSILDLDQRNDQPMESNDERFTLVFNGEIYNFKELKKIYLKNYKFKTTGDTEVLLALYEKFGKNILTLLDGMYAFCIFDKKKNEAFLARDFFAQKPLFYSIIKNKLFFSSEIKVLEELGIPLIPNYYSWYRYLVHGSYDDSKDTFFKDIYQLEPGQSIIWNLNKKIKVKKNFFPENYVNKSITDNFNKAKNKIQFLIDKSTKIHLRSDVPVGLNLSGGLDSSILLSSFKKNLKKKGKLKTYSVDFGKSFSEKKWINLISKQYKVSNKLITFSKKNFLDSIKPLMWFHEAPLGGLMNCALAKLIKVARKDNIKVLQDGSGLDEFLGGYQKHHNFYMNLLKKNNKKKFENNLKKYSKFWNLSLSDARSQIKKENNKYTALDSSRQIRSDIFLNSFIKGKYKNSISKFNKSGSKLHNELLDFTFIRKIPRNTRMRDRVSMASSVELRFPYLNVELFKYAISLNQNFYFKDGYSKSIARFAFSKKIKNDLIFANKRSVQSPQTEWLRTEPMRSYINKLINSKSFANRGFYNISKVKKAYKKFCEKKHENSFFVWQWINLEEWFRLFIDKKSVHSRLKNIKLTNLK